MGVLEPSGCFTPGWNIQKFTFLGLQSVSVPRCANTPRLVSEVVSWSSLSPISVTSEPRDNTWSALSSLTGLKDWIQRRNKTLFQPRIMLKCYSCLTQLYEFLRVGDSNSCSLFFLLFSFKLICHSFKKNTQKNRKSQTSCKEIWSKGAGSRGSPLLYTSVYILFKSQITICPQMPQYYNTSIIPVHSKTLGKTKQANIKWEKIFTL